VYVPPGSTDTVVYGEDIEAVLAAFTTAGTSIATAKSRKTARRHLITSLPGNNCLIILATSITCVSLRVNNILKRGYIELLNTDLRGDGERAHPSQARNYC